MSNDVCHDEPLGDGTGRVIRIPYCWPAVLHGDERCTCPGTPGGIEMDRRGAVLVRLFRMRDRRRAIEARAAGLALMPGSRIVLTKEHVPVRLRNLRVVRESAS